MLAKWKHFAKLWTVSDTKPSRQLVTTSSCEATPELPIKVDLHVETPTNTDGLKLTERRVRPLGYTSLHAHRTDEAVGSSMFPVRVPFVAGLGVVPESTEGVTQILTPNCFTFLAMKLSALRDRLNAARSGDGDSLLEYAEADRHAFDMFAIWAATDEQAWGAALAVRSATRGLKARAELSTAARALFGEPEALGRLRLVQALRDHGHQPDDGDVERFVASVLELLLLPDGK